MRLFLESISDELLHFKTGKRYEYLLTDSENNQFEVTINEINPSDRYIELYTHEYNVSVLKPGKINFICILDYDKLPDMDKLEKMGFDRFPTFHEAYIEVIAKEDNYLHLRFSGGFHPLITDIKMSGVFKEEACMENNANPYEYFAQGHGLNHVQFQTIDDYFIVKLDGSVIYETLIGGHEGISNEEADELWKNPNNIKTEKYTNEYTIYCSKISFEFKKERLEEDISI